ncbi:Bgt-20908 [Blumeria graminis f. sp. tritici]|uniref:Bgt-20908 n=2 Tax=Blumeria graminis f. sp. tritici TaxID=62690 RepID=A0A9X9MK88_BLUGR|nr:Bgt-20908 [Blumeria graminis f. sp. tritici]
MQVTIFTIYKGGNQFGENSLILSVYIPINLLNLPSGSAAHTVQPVWIPSFPFPDRFIIRNCYLDFQGKSR